ncbi:hypothetical protein LTS10_013067 [Elasticomyces elasticus]|nr:hypothetical protein LTS10_013067 [Elasticomyces elasticus]
MERCTQCNSVQQPPSPKRSGPTINNVNSHVVEIDFGGIKFATNVNALKAASRPLAAYLNSQKAELPLEVSFDGFEIVVGWLSKGTIRTDEDTAREAREEDEGEDEDDEEFEEGLHIRSLCNAYKTAEVLEISADFLDAVMDRIIDTVIEKPSKRTEDDVIDLAGIMSEAFEPGSPGRLFTVEWLLHDRLEVEGSDPSWDFTLADFIENNEADNFRNEFLLAVFRGKLAGNLLPWEVEGKSRYHASRNGVLRFPSIIRDVATRSDSGGSDDWGM